MNPFVAQSVCQERVKQAASDGFLKKRGIVRVSHSGASIGFSEEEQKWYGWSHRAIYGFGVGSKVEKGNIAYGVRGAWEAKTLADAKQMAINFSKGVS